MKITGYPVVNGKGHRQFDLRLVSNSMGIAWLEDDFHHFGVTVSFESDHITDIRMATRRAPWTTCHGASEALGALIGKPIVKRASDIGKLIDMRLQCTHVFDLTGLLLAHIANRNNRQLHRRYHSVVEDRPACNQEYELKSFGLGHAYLYQDDRLVMTWAVDGDRIVSPNAFRDISLDKGFRSWTEKLPEQEAEYATILRRAIMIGCARAIDSDDFPTAADMSLKSLCHSFQPERVREAKRNFGNARNYSGTPDRMLLNTREIP